MDVNKDFENGFAVAIAIAQSVLSDPRYFGQHGEEVSVEFITDLLYIYNTLDLKTTNIEEVKEHIKNITGYEV